MAEGLLKAKAGAHTYVQSCGLEATEPNDLMVAVMKEIGIDLSGHRSRSLAMLGDSSFDLVIAFTEDAGEAARSVFDDSDTDIRVWPMPDPTANVHDVRSMMNNFRALRDLIGREIDRLIETQ